MSAQYTPGPWVIFDLHDATRLNVRGPNEEFVADCADGFYSDETDDWIMAEESLPNARLIAAAPDLVEALAASTAEMMGVVKRLEDAGLGNLVGGCARQCDMNRNALSKALGEGEA